MRYKVISGNLLEAKAELLVLPVFEGKTPLRGTTRKADGILKGAVRRMLDDGEFRARPRQVRVISVLEAKNGLRAKRVLLVGLGKSDNLTADGLRGVSAMVARTARDLRIETIHAELPIVSLKVPVNVQAQVWMEGAVMGLYRMNDYRKEDSIDGVVRTIVLLSEERDAITPLRQGLDRGQKLGEATNFARDLVTHPPNVAVPAFLASEARGMARKTGLLCEILNDRDTKRLGMKAFLSVGQGSVVPSKFIVLEHRGRDSRSAPIVLVGKGVTFDTGGLDVKPAASMRSMKTDMAGAAAVIGAMKAISELKIAQRVVGLAPCTENMISGRANRPGDVVGSMAGLTVEIDNTDAEGRLILGDALTYAKRYQPVAVVDAATLTGACVVALGESCTGLMGNHGELIERIQKAAERSGDRVWELPLWPEYFELIKSDIADIKNTGGRWGGAITAAAYLARFAEEFPWAHLDIAGPSWRDRELPYTPKGASGVGVRIMVELVSNWKPLRSKKRKWD